MKEKTPIATEAQYGKTMEEILSLMNKGEKNLSKAESEHLREMAFAAQQYEKERYTIPAPVTIEGMIELKMYERRLKQKELAQLMGLSEPKLSQILSGKRAPDIAFLKAAHQKLGIDASFLLNHV
ncbi:helix-turn-helix domain-containing protein [Dinghuibacter silviterrae]|uniref:HTH-type transcriptional regulator/antitoxin HigA n=1 Tax=Dinghuibacter silviterrae TaxID=1539049 RepID=A0A4R8DUK9_9BACT|nr:helix-turn-helix domain-containing protein [Dinghuibacter silviterrae]TDX01608.1 HTH-type transcriptional regulator/antitoxin HigA [Dinghuibacter silviterrae]